MKLIFFLAVLLLIGIKIIYIELNIHSFFNIKKNYSVKLINDLKSQIRFNRNFRKNKKCIQNINENLKINLDPSYNFLIAGHVYGLPDDKNLGIYPKFFRHLKYRKYNFDLVLFAGDVTRSGNKFSYDFFDHQIDELNFKNVHIAPGNHEIDTPEKRTYFFKRYGNTFKSFIFKNDLFIILDPLENNWSIKDKQLMFLKNLLKKNYLLVDNIFIITHQLIFYERVKAHPNNFKGKAKYINFWDEIYPLAQKYENNYYFIAGDVGAIDNGFELFCRKYENSIFLATGMGNGKRDNYLIFEKFEKKFQIKLKTF